MNQRMTAALLLFGLCLGSCSQFPGRWYFYVNEPLTWTEAQQYCRERYTDLATFESMDDIKRLQPHFSYSSAWIGLWDDPNAWKSQMGNKSNSWRWSATGEPSKTGYQSWSSINPDYYLGNEMCVVFYYFYQWVDTDCSLPYTSICYNVTEQNVKQFFYISTKRTWSSAQKYCRENYHDLAVIENQEENYKALSLIPTSDMSWIGLYRVPWVWSDGSPGLFRHWDSTSPSNYDGAEHCVTENELHEWNDDKCGTPHVFICHQVTSVTSFVRMTTVTDANLTNPDISAQLLQQLGDLLTSQGWTDFKLKWKNILKKEEQK